MTKSRQISDLLDGLEIDGDLTVDTNTLHVDSTNNRVGIGTTSPLNKLDLAEAGDTQLRITSTDGNNVRLGLNSSGTVYNWIEANGTNLLFAVGNAERMRIDSSGNVGIGTSSVNSPAGGRTVLEVNGTSTALFHLGIGGSAKGQLYHSGSEFRINSIGTDPMTFFANGSERMRIDSSGNVGIGTSSPESVSNYKMLTVGNSSTERGVINASDGTVKASVWTTNSGVARLGSRSNHPVTLEVNGDEKMRIDSSGSVLVGKTTTDVGTQGARLDSSGRGFFTRSSSFCLQANRLSNDGEIMRFSKDGTTVGSIGAISSRPYISTSYGSDSGLRFDSAFIAPCTTTGSGRDNAIDLGDAGNRFDDIYATNGTIQTSDRNEKQDIEALSEAEQRVAVAAKGLLRKFRWIDSVEEKGDDARIHFGIIAQDLQAAFEAEGLDAGRYAMFINSNWTDEETGEECSRMGVRYNQLLAFIIAAI